MYVCEYVLVCVCVCMSLDFKHFESFAESMVKNESTLRYLTSEKVWMERPFAESVR